MKSYYDELNEWLDCFNYIKITYGNFMNNIDLFESNSDIFRILHRKVFDDVYDRVSINTIMQGIFPFNFSHSAYSSDEMNFKSWYRYAEETADKIKILLGKTEDPDDKNIK